MDPKLFVVRAQSGLNCPGAQVLTVVCANAEDANVKYPPVADKAEIIFFMSISRLENYFLFVNTQFEAKFKTLLVFISALLPPPLLAPLILK